MGINLFTFLTPETLEMLARGLKATLVLTAFSWLIAATVGSLLAVANDLGVKPIQVTVGAFVAYQRNVPALAHMLLWYFGVPTLLPDSLQAWINANHGEVLLASIALGLCLGAYFCEDLRSGLRTVTTGQHAAATALGMSYGKRMRHVILPQAVRAALPTLVNHTVLLFKTTSLAMAIGAAELTYVVREVENQTFRTFDAYFVATAIYLFISLGLMAGGAMLERRLGIHAR